MKHFTKAADVADIQVLVERAKQAKANPLKYRHLGAGRAICLLFFNPSLRTRLSTQRAAQLLGLEAMVMDFGKEGWKLEYGDKVIMSGDTQEHIREAAGVVSQYCDIIGIRTFPELVDREADYAEPVLEAFMHYASVPIVSLESATRHPLQSLADLITISEHQSKPQPKIVLSWAPHPRALPQAVANSFAEWTQAAGHEIIVACPEGFELADHFLKGHQLTHDQDAALANADFVYAKNWSAYHQYGNTTSKHDDWQICSQKMALTNNARFMHCLPVRRNVVVADEVLDSPQSLVLEQANNRTWAAYAVLQTLLDG